MRVGVAGAVLAMLGAPAAAQQPSMPAPAVQGIARVNILCLLVDPSRERLHRQDRLCAQVRRVAATGAPVPVATVGFGDPALLAPDSLGVLVHAAVDRDRLVLSVRPYRTRTSDTLFFGATPAALPLGANGAPSDAGIAAALDQILPWRMAAAR